MSPEESAMREAVEMAMNNGHSWRDAVELAKRVAKEINDERNARVAQELFGK